MQMLGGAEWWLQACAHSVTILAVHQRRVLFCGGAIGQFKKLPKMKIKVSIS